MSEQTKCERTRAVAHALHSTRMEGGEVPAPVEAEMHRYAGGDISAEDLLERTREHVADYLQAQRSADE